MGGDASSVVQIKATANTNNPKIWACQSIELINTDPVRTYTFTATQIVSPFQVLTQAVNAGNNPVTLAVGGAFTFGAPTLNDDGTMGKPSWPVGWVISGNWV
jgi:hypothetical protein